MQIDTSRRSFLGAAAGVAGLGVIGAPSASAVVEAEPWGIKLGIATYSLREFDRHTAIEMLKKMQVKYISIKDVHLKIGAPAEETKAGRSDRLRAADASASSAGTSAQPIAAAPGVLMCSPSATPSARPAAPAAASALPALSVHAMK